MEGLLSGEDGMPEFVLHQLNMTFSDGGDIHVAIDATFSQRHNLAAGDSPWFYEPRYFVSKEEVDQMGDRITAARSKGPRSYKSGVPEAALDECEKSYEAANEKKDKSASTKFDDTGLMALVCRHDVVIFLANIDTPGEQQKFGVALIEHLFSHLPKEATLVVYYDIGCVLDRSLRRVRHTILCRRATVDTFVKVSYLVRCYHAAANLFHIRYACIWAPMGLSTRIQSSIARRHGSDRGRGYRASLV